MTIDRILAMLAVATLVAFLAPLVGFVPEIDLILVIIFGLALALYDFVSQLR